jgi:hypothetical protein
MFFSITLTILCCMSLVVYVFPTPLPPLPTNLSRILVMFLSLRPSDDHKGSHCFDPSSVHVLITHHVTFDEHMFSYVAAMSLSLSHSLSHSLFSQPQRRPLPTNELGFLPAPLSPCVPWKNPTAGSPRQPVVPQNSTVGSTASPTATQNSVASSARLEYRTATTPDSMLPHKPLSRLAILTCPTSPSL